MRAVGLAAVGCACWGPAGLPYAAFFTCASDSASRRPVTNSVSLQRGTHDMPDEPVMAPTGLLACMEPAHIRL